MEDGSIGEGKHFNETTWRISQGRLEIVQEDGAVHSRFVMLSNGDDFQHTSDPDLPSIKNQSLSAVWLVRIGARGTPLLTSAPLSLRAG
jgi:hypothetical protein